MATHNPLLADWVKNAYGMEMSLVTVLEKQVQDVQQDSKLGKGINRHLEATRHHVDLLRGCLQRMGENTSGIQPANPLASMYREGNGNGHGSDVSLQTGLMDYVTENFEVAAYRALAALAQQMGDHDTVRICEQILQDELTMVHSLDEIMPQLRSQGNGAQSQASSGQASSTPGQGAGQQNVRLTQENFDAFNAHDLERWQKTLAEDFCSEAPGSTSSMDGKQNRAYIQNFITAFPDLHFEMLRTIAQGDHVVQDWEATGTHSGSLRSPDGRAIPATHKRAKVFGSTTFECRDGKIRRSWVYFDMSMLMEQLGLTGRP